MSFERPIEMESNAMFKANVMLAFSKGKKVEMRVKSIPNDQWFKAPMPCWNWELYDYRVAAPEPRRIWVQFDSRGHALGVFNAQPFGHSFGQFVEFVEVLKPSAT